MGENKKTGRPQEQQQQHLVWQWAKFHIDEAHLTHLLSYLDVVDVDDLDRASYERHRLACHYQFY